MTFNSFITQKYTIMDTETNKTIEGIINEENTDINNQEEEWTNERIDAIIAAYRAEKRKQGSSKN